VSKRTFLPRERLLGSSSITSADSIPPLDPNSSILLLIGRDVLPAQYVLSQKIGKQDQPYAQLLQLGSAIIGESCLDGIHGQSSVNGGFVVIL
jgi:hypothetical protein